MELTLISIEDLRKFLREEFERGLSRPALIPPDQPRFLAISAAVKKHGVSKSFLYRLSSERTVSTRRVGKCIEFDAQELESYFDKTAKRSKAAIDADLKKDGVFPTLKGKPHV